MGAHRLPTAPRGWTAQMSSGSSCVRTSSNRRPLSCWGNSGGRSLDRDPHVARKHPRVERTRQGVIGDRPDRVRSARTDSPGHTRFATERSLARRWRCRRASLLRSKQAFFDTCRDCNQSVSPGSRTTSPVLFLIFCSAVRYALPGIAGLFLLSSENFDSNALSFVSKSRGTTLSVRHSTR
jgi:hypothetical protein